MGEFVYGVERRQNQRTLRVQAAPHPFKRLSWLHPLCCRHCYRPRSMHPVAQWVTARHLASTVRLSRKQVKDSLEGV